MSLNLSEGWPIVFYAIGPSSLLRTGAVSVLREACGCSTPSSRINHLQAGGGFRSTLWASFHAGSLMPAVALAHPGRFVRLAAAVAVARVLAGAALALAVLPRDLVALELADQPVADVACVAVDFPAWDDLAREHRQVQGAQLERVAQGRPLGAGQVRCAIGQGLPRVVCGPVHLDGEPGGAHGRVHAGRAQERVVVLELALLGLDEVDRLADGLEERAVATVLPGHGPGDPLHAARAERMVGQVPDLDHVAVLTPPHGVQGADVHVVGRALDLAQLVRALGRALGAERALVVGGGRDVPAAGALEHGFAAGALDATHPVGLDLGGLDLLGGLALGGLALGLGLTLGALGGLALGLGLTLGALGLGADALDLALQPGRELGDDVHGGALLVLVALDPEAPVDVELFGVVDGLLDGGQAVDAQRSAVEADEPADRDVALGDQGVGRDRAVCLDHGREVTHVDVDVGAVLVLALGDRDDLLELGHGLGVAHGVDEHADRVEAGLVADDLVGQGGGQVDVGAGLDAHQVGHDLVGGELVDLEPAAVVHVDLEVEAVLVADGVPAQTALGRLELANLRLFLAATVETRPGLHGAAGLGLVGGPVAALGVGADGGGQVGGGGGHGCTPVRCATHCFGQPVCFGLVPYSTVAGWAPRPSASASSIQFRKVHAR